MTLLEKRDLLTLLNKYQDELLQKLDEDGKFRYKDEFGIEIGHGYKAQYDHARIIIRKLSKEISDEVKTY